MGKGVGSPAFRRSHSFCPFFRVPRGSIVCLTFLDLGGAQDTGHMNSRDVTACWGMGTSCDLSFRHHTAPSMYNFSQNPLCLSLCLSHFQESKSEMTRFSDSTSQPFNRSLSEAGKSIKRQGRWERRESSMAEDRC